MKLIRLINCYSVWWWINVTDNDPPASGKEFKTRIECVKDARKRIGHVKFEEYKTSKEREQELEYENEIW